MKRKTGAFREARTRLVPSRSGGRLGEYLDRLDHDRLLRYVLGERTA